MKRIVVVLGLVLGELMTQAQEPGFHLVGIESKAIPVTGTKMTNLIFPVGVAAGINVSRDVLVQKPKGVENIILLKAIRRHFLPTNLSVYGRDGQLYSFDLHYVEDTAIWNFQVVRNGGMAARDTVRTPVQLSGLPVDGATLDRDAALLAERRGFLRASVRSAGMKFRLRGIYLRDSLLWLSFRLSNGTNIGFTPAFVRVAVEDRKKVKRTASQDVELLPVVTGSLGQVPGNQAPGFSLGFSPFAVGKGKKLVVEIADDSGGRNLELRVKGKLLLKARKR